AKEGAATTLWQEDKAQVPALGPAIDDRTRQSGLRRAQCHAALSRLRSDLASGRTTGPLRRRHSPDQGLVPVDGHGPLSERWRHYLSIWPALQDRAQLQAGGPPDRRLRISFLDDGYDPFALPQRQSARAIYARKDRRCRPAGGLFPLLGLTMRDARRSIAAMVAGADQITHGRWPRTFSRHAGARPWG